VARFYPYHVTLIAAALGFFLKKVADRTPLVFTPLDPWLWLISTYLALSVFWAPNTPLALVLSLNVIFHLLLYHLVVNTLTGEKALRIYMIVLICASVVWAGGIFGSKDVDESSFISLGKHLELQMEFGEHNTRPAGFGGSDHVGGFLATSIFACLANLLLHKGWLRRTFLLVLIAYFFSAVLYTVSRGGLIAISAAFFFSFAFQRQLRPHLLKLTAIFGVTSLLLIILVSPGLIDRLLIGFGYTGQLVVANRQFTSNEANTAVGGNVTGMGARVNWWKSVLKEMNRHPWKYLTGVGLGGFPIYSVYQGDASPESNNIYGSFFFEGGLLGVMVLFPILYIVTMNAFNSYYLARENWHVLTVTAMAMVISDMAVRGLIDYDLISYGSKFCWNQLAFLMATVGLVNRGDPRASLRLGLPGRKGRSPALTGPFARPTATGQPSPAGAAGHETQTSVTSLASDAVSGAYT
jgi:O-antigen ligase